MRTPVTGVCRPRAGALARQRPGAIARTTIGALVLTLISAAGCTVSQSGSGSTTQPGTGSVSLTFPTVIPTALPSDFATTDAIACVSVSWCVSATQSVSSGGGKPASRDTLQLFDGTSWSPMAGGMAPAGAAISALACVSKSYCLAVGGDRGTALAMHWGGSSWSLLSNPATGSASLLAVYCPAAGSCQAVGLDSRGALTETLSGTSWTIDANDYSAGQTAPGTTLTGVSCPSSSSCYAVGNKPHSPGNLPIAVSLDAGTWKTLPMPALPDTIASPGGSLDAISCQSPGRCLAFGSRGALTLGMTFSDGKWTETSSASPAFPALYAAFHLACAGTTTWCMAAGTDISGNATPLFLETEASGWTILPAASLAPDLSGEILGISCTTQSFCLAVGWRSEHGNSPGSPLVERFDGSSWSLAPSPPAG